MMEPNISIETYQAVVNECNTLKQENDILKQDNAILKHELEQLKRMIFGSKSERFISKDDNQLKLDLNLQEEEKQEVKKETITFTRTKKEGKKRSIRLALPSNLPRKQEVIEPENLPDGSKKIGELITEILEYNPGKLYVRKIVRPKYALPNEEGILNAELPTLPIPKGNAGAGLLSHLFVSKYVDHLPFYRQVQMFKRDNLHIPESTINGWFSQCCRLLSPLYDKLKQEVLLSNYIMADETPISVLTHDKPGSSHKGYLWVYHSPIKKLVYFDYQKSRAREGPLEFFKHYKGTIQTDGYTAYDIFDKKPDIILLACMAHARRKFEHSIDNDHDRAKFALELIQQLYAIEKEARLLNLSFEERKLLRDEKSVPLLQLFEKWLKEQLPDVLPKSSIGVAISYTLGLWNRLIRYTLDGHYEIDNNLIENTIRPIALGRKNYLFAGSHEGAQRAAMMYSFLGSCKINNVNPFEWLKHILTVIPDYKANRIDELLPCNFISNISKNNI